MIWKELELLKNKYLATGLSEAIDYEKFSMMSIVYHSTKIEGCSLTESDTKVLLENGVTAK
ncbi:MAG: Fic family protein, partial [Chlorobiaceae bacterium]